MSSEYEDALVEMNDLLQTENEDLHAKNSALQLKYDDIFEAKAHHSTTLITDPISGVGMAVSNRELASFYLRAQELLVKVAFNLKRDPIDYGFREGLDLTFGMRMCGAQRSGNRGATGATMQSPYGYYELDRLEPIHTPSSLKDRLAIKYKSDEANRQYDMQRMDHKK